MDEIEIKQKLDTLSEHLDARLEMIALLAERYDALVVSVAPQADFEALAAEYETRDMCLPRELAARVGIAIANRSRIQYRIPTETCRAILKMLHIQRMTFDQIYHALGMSQGEIRTIIDYLKERGIISRGHHGRYALSDRGLREIGAENEQLEPMKELA